MEHEIGTPLRVFAEGKTQPELARLLGVSQSAVSQMLNSSRDIRVRSEGGGKYKAFEIKPVGSRKKT
ncbi:MAG: helix-turn-helix domain-containing protein [Pseudomonas helleri]|uniref:helix-turn-helix domain-containing protein n=1 Tax=Pseudomonas helleri TaxID=1608996 RepID=UPI003F9980FB